MKMKPVISLYIPLLLSLSLVATSSFLDTCKSAAGVEHTCKAASDANPSIDYDFCITSLNSQPNTNSAGLQGLAAAATKLAIAHAESAQSNIEDLMDLELEPAAKDKYGECLDAYEDAGDQMKDALDSINSGMHSKATRLLRAAPGAHKRCEEVFKGLEGVASPVAVRSGEYGRLVEIAMAIAAMVEY